MSSDEGIADFIRSLDLLAKQQKKSFYESLIMTTGQKPGLFYNALIFLLKNDHKHKLEDSDKEAIINALDLLKEEEQEKVCEMLMEIAYDQEPQDLNFALKIVSFALKKNNKILDKIFSARKYEVLVQDMMRSGLVIERDLFSKLSVEAQNQLNSFAPANSSDLNHVDHFIQHHGSQVLMPNSVSSEHLSIYDIGSENAGDVEEISSSTRDHHNLENHDDIFKKENLGIANSASLGLIGIFGVFMIGYELAAKNAIIRNAYSDYLRTIKNISDEELLEITKNYSDHEERINQIKLLVRNKLATQMYNNTIYAGLTGTLLFSGVLASFMGPFALIPASIGGLVTLGAATRNKNILLQRIDQGIANNDLLDQAISEKIIAYDKVENKASRSVTDSRIRMLVSGTFAATVSLRFLLLMQLGLSSVTPFLFGTMALFRSAVSWRATNDSLAKMYEKPADALRSALYIDIESLSMTSNTFSRNKFKRYLLENMEEVESLMAENDVFPRRKSGKLEYATRKVMSTLGLWENEKFNSVLEALYFPDNNSHMLLEYLRHECAKQALDKKLSKYLDKYGKKLDIQHESLDVLHASGDKVSYNKLLRAYLNDRAVKNAGNLVNMTGINTTATVAVIVVSVGAVFTPAAPLALAALGIIAAGYIGTKIAQHYHRKKMKNLVENVSDDDVKDIMNHSMNNLSISNFKNNNKIKSKKSFLFRDAKEEPQDEKIIPVSEKISKIIPGQHDL